MESEEGHGVGPGQRDRGHLVEVVTVVVVQTHSPHAGGKQCRMHPVRPAAAILVGLDLHQRGLGAAGHPRDPPRVRVRLLEVIDRAVSQEFGVLHASAVTRKVLRHTWAVVVPDEFRESSRYLGWRYGRYRQL